MMKGADREFVILVKGLPAGRHDMSFRVDKELFTRFGNNQVHDASVNVELKLFKGTEIIEIESFIKGDLVVECDRCLEELTLPVETKATLVVKFERGDNDIDSDEVIVLDPADGELDMSQFLYDYICLSLPIKRVHEQGKCNPEMIRMLERSNSDSSVRETGSPFDKLKDILNN